MAGFDFASLSRSRLAAVVSRFLLGPVLETVSPRHRFRTVMKIRRASCQRSDRSPLDAHFGSVAASATAHAPIAAPRSGTGYRSDRTSSGLPSRKRRRFLYRSRVHRSPTVAERANVPTERPLDSRRKRRRFRYRSRVHPSPTVAERANVPNRTSERLPSEASPLPLPLTRSSQTDRSGACKRSEPNVFSTPVGSVAASATAHAFIPARP